METNKAEGKRSFKGKMEDDEEEEDEDVGEDDKKKRVMTDSGKKGSSGGGFTPAACQVENCTTDMTDAKRYHRRHKVCEIHAKAPVVLVAGIQQRFCQQCSSRFHVLSEFDEAKRSCRRRLAGHNERRRKSSSEFHGEGSS